MKIWFYIGEPAMFGGKFKDAILDSKFEVFVM